jgi:hypothetical protein
MSGAVRGEEPATEDIATREEILQRRPDLMGKSLEAMRRILRRERRLALKPKPSSKSK